MGTTEGWYVYTVFFWCSLAAVNTLLAFSFFMYFYVRFFRFDRRNLAACRRSVVLLTLANVILLAGDLLRRTL